MSVLRQSLLSGAVLPLCSIVPYGFAPAEPFSGYAMSPGIIFGMYGSAMIDGNPHGVNIAGMLIIASFVNFLFWAFVCYCALSAYRRFSKSSR